MDYDDAMQGVEKKKEKEQENDGDGDVCALFATSTPRDIWANPSLAAIAALIDEDEDQKQEESNEAEEEGIILPYTILQL